MTTETRYGTHCLVEHGGCGWETGIGRSYWLPQARLAWHRLWCTKPYRWPA